LRPVLDKLLRLRDDSQNLIQRDLTQCLPPMRRLPTYWLQSGKILSVSSLRKLRTLCLNLLAKHLRKKEHVSAPIANEGRGHRIRPTGIRGLANTGVT
jgi:hypothetical protein